MSCSSSPDQGPASVLSTPELRQLVGVHRPRPAARALPPPVGRNRRQTGRSPAPEPPLPLLLAALLCLGALLLAPERPRDQEAICQRHKGAEACRVW